MYYSCVFEGINCLFYCFYIFWYIWPDDGCFVKTKHVAVYRRTASSSLRVHYIYHKPDIVSRTVLWPLLPPQLAFKLHNTTRCRCSRSRAFWKLEIIRVKWRPLQRTAFVSRHAIVWNSGGSTSSRDDIHKTNKLTQYRLYRLPSSLRPLCLNLTSRTMLPTSSHKHRA